MSNILNPMVNMPWDIYLDFLADQGFDDLREGFYFAITSTDLNISYHDGYTEHGIGVGTNWGCSFPNNSFDNRSYGEEKIMSYDEIDTMNFGCGHGALYDYYHFSGCGSR